MKNKDQSQNRLKKKTKTYEAIYRGEVVQVLEQIWEIYGQICSKRLQPFLPEAIKVLERHKAIEISTDAKDLLLKISSASIDRCLRPIRIQTPHGLSTTKPGSLLKHLIPIQPFTEWDQERPGFMEIDLVAHCGTTTEGQYLNTTMLGALCHYVTHADLKDFQPMKANFGILPPLQVEKRGGKLERGKAYAERALSDLGERLARVPA